MRLTLILLLIGLTGSAQELSCEDFRTGEFYIPETEEMGDYQISTNDTITEFKLERDPNISKYIVIREENTQIEWRNGIGNGIPKYEIIEWIDECTYRLTYDPSKTELDEEQKWVNDNNGIVVSKNKIEDKCLYYTATMTTNEGEKILQDGIICKE